MWTDFDFCCKRWQKFPPKGAFGLRVNGSAMDLQRACAACFSKKKIALMTLVSK